MIRPCRYRWTCLVAILYCSNTAVAQFDTIINIPPDPSPISIAAGTQINVFDGGLLAYRFDLFDQHPGGEINFFGGGADFHLTVNGAIVNLYEGMINYGLKINTGSTVNVAGGVVDQFDANAASEVNISGGRIGFGARANAGSTVAVSGGTIGRAFTAGPGSTVTFTGGYVEGALRTELGSHVTLMGGVFGEDFKARGALTFHGDDFSLNGEPVPGLNSVGDQVQLVLPVLSQFTGTLGDGSPFSFSYLDDDDQLQNASITLVRTALPPIGALEIHLPAEPAPRGVRSGQTLVVGEGAVVRDDFHAGIGSKIIVEGGTIGDNFEVAGARVDISGGVVGDNSGVFAGSVLNILGGSIGRNFRPLPGSIVNVAGGHVESVYAPGASEIRISGGTLGDGFWARADTNVLVRGSGFRLNGALIPGLEIVGNTVSIDLPSTYVLSGTFSDGTPFVFASNEHDRFESGTLSLLRSEVAPVETAMINVPASPAPRGLRDGQTLFVHEGGELGRNFNAGSGSTIEISGGTVGDNLEAVGATVHLVDGHIGNWFDAFVGTTVVIEGGSVGQGFYAGRGSVVNVSGGYVSSLSALDVSTISISGGEINSFAAYEGPQVTISGGTFNGLYAGSGAAVELIGTHFILDGKSILGLESPGDSISLPNRNGELLHVRLRDGSTYDFILRTASRGVEGNFATGSTLRLTLAVPEPSVSLLSWLSLLFLPRRSKHR